MGCVGLAASTWVKTSDDGWGYRDTYSGFHIGVARYATTYVVSAFRRTTTVRLKPDTTYS